MANAGPNTNGSQFFMYVKKQNPEKISSFAIFSALLVELFLFSSPLHNALVAPKKHLGWMENM
jgi:cyclophilin family peptidyl-prolyl cis-trans isomerase